MCYHLDERTGSVLSECRLRTRYGWPWIENDVDAETGREQSVPQTASEVKASLAVCAGNHDALRKTECSQPTLETGD